MHLLFYTSHSQRHFTCVQTCICTGFILYILTCEHLEIFKGKWALYLLGGFLPLPYSLTLLPKPQTQSKGKGKMQSYATRKTPLTPLPQRSLPSLWPPDPCTLLTHATSLGMQLCLKVPSFPCRIHVLFIFAFPVPGASSAPSKYKLWIASSQNSDYSRSWFIEYLIFNKCSGQVGNERKWVHFYWLQRTQSVSPFK